MSYDITIECGENFNDKAEIEGRVVPYLKEIGYELTCHTTPDADTVITLIGYKGESK